MPSVRSIVLAAAAAGVAFAETHIVKVGQTGNTFDPQMVTAAEGDIVEFQFWPKNHSVVAGDMTAGCTPLSGTTGFYSGYIPVASGKGDMAFQVKIENTDPWVFYCSQAKHCIGGMYGMINGNDTALASYGALAKAATVNKAPASTEAFGGDITTASATTGNTTTSGGNSTNAEGGSGVVAASMGMSFAAFAAAILLS